VDGLGTVVEQRRRDQSQMGWRQTSYYRDGDPANVEIF
jgi:hypothetical protein